MPRSKLSTWAEEETGYDCGIWQQGKKSPEVRMRMNQRKTRSGKRKELLILCQLYSISASLGNFQLQSLTVGACRYHKSLPTLLSIHNDQTLLINSLTLTPGAISLPILRRLSGHHDEIIDLQYLTPSDNLIALATNSEDIRIVNIDKGFGDVGVLRGHGDIVICLDRDWSGVWLASAGKDNEARLWKIDGEKKDFTCYACFTGHAESIGAIALSRAVPQAESAAAKGHAPPKFLLTGSQDRTVKKWEVPAGGKKARAVYTRKAHDKDINAIDVSPDDELFASASQDRTVKIWSVEEGEVLGVLRGHRRGVWSVKFAPSTITAAVVGGVEGAKGGRMVVTGSGDKTVKLWSLTDYSCLRTFEGHTNSVLKTVWLSGGLQVGSSGGDGLVKVWDVKSGECNTTLDNHEDKVFIFSPVYLFLSLSLTISRRSGH